MKHYKLKEKAARNQRLIRYRLEHPGMTIRAIAKIFHITHPRVAQILAEAKHSGKTATITLASGESNGGIT